MLVCLAVEVFSPSTAAAQDKPGEMQGFLRSKVRGLSAVQGGFLSGSIMAVATGTGMQAAVVNMLRLLGGAAKLSKDPSMAEMYDYLRTGKGFDFSGAPVSAGYDVHLDFVLVSDGKGDYRLKSGNASYSGSTDADLSLGEGAGAHRFTDQFRSQATVELTPENASITLATTGKGKDRRSQFDVNVRFPVPLVGKTTWSAMGGLSVVTVEERADASITHHRAFGQENTETRPGGAQWNAGVVYSYSGPSDSMLRGRETWQDITDSGEMVEWELWGECQADMLSPEENDELVYDALVPAKIERLALARVQPSFWEQDLDWSFHEIAGSDLEPRPDKTKGNDFDVTYTKLPDKNSAFAFWDVEASDMHDFLRSTDQIDMSGWPVKAEYGADAFFTLDEGKEGVFQLKDGSVTWSTRNDTRVELNGGDGNIHILHDKASGQGSSRLTPELSSITLVTEGKGKDATFTLNLDVAHPMPYDANALWSMMGGLAVLRIEEHSGTQQSHMTMFGQAYSEPP
ncbi:MAG: hypothetical protein H0T44_13135, partial [Gemmatimonadales bacterium]|nr:hypothetical protein [Gemmatimonadales bacterium]